MIKNLTKNLQIEVKNFKENEEQKFKFQHPIITYRSKQQNTRTPFETKKFQLKKIFSLLQRHESQDKIIFLIDCPEHKRHQQRKLQRIHRKSNQQSPIPSVQELQNIQKQCH